MPTQKLKCFYKGGIVRNLLLAALSEINSILASKQELFDSKVVRPLIFNKP